MQKKMTPREFAAKRNLQPQLVYYYLRTGALTEYKCECGRKVIDIAEADALFRAKHKKKQQKKAELEAVYKNTLKRIQGQQ